MGREVRRVPLDFDHPLGRVLENPPTGEGWQVWETVSDGSPVTPVFATAEELAQHLCTHGDAWHQRDRPLPSYESALRFVLAGWAPSGMIVGGVLKTSYETYE